MPIFKIMGPAKPVKYSSKDTRGVSLQQFMGGAEFNEVNTVPGLLPCETPEHLEARFRSGANRTDLPAHWGYPSVVRKLAGHRLDTGNEIKSWRRVGGEPLYDDDTLKKG